MRRAFAAGIALSLLLPCASARAEGTPSTPPPTAEDLFKEAKTLRDKGQVEEACARFSESFQMQAGVGTALYLGDCYEKLGRTAAAFSAFKDALRIASEHKDRRASVARKHVEALEPKLGHLTVSVDETLADAVVSLDGHPLARESLNVSIAADPGDHVLKLNVPGHPEIVEHAHVELGPNAPIVKLELPAPPPPAPEPPPAPPVAPAKQEAALPPPSAASTQHGNPEAEATVSRRWLTVGLLGIGALGIGTGSAFLLLKNHSMTNGGASGYPTVDERDSAASIVAFGMGGAAVAAAIIVHLTTPKARQSAGLQVSPLLLGTAGGGATLSGEF
jgi:hypothetical protein